MFFKKSFYSDILKIVAKGLPEPLKSLEIRKLFKQVENEEVKIQTPLSCYESEKKQNSKTTKTD